MFACAMVSLSEQFKTSLVFNCILLSFIYIDCYWFIIISKMRKVFCNQCSKTLGTQIHKGKAFGTDVLPWGDKNCIRCSNYFHWFVLGYFLFFDNCYLYVHNSYLLCIWYFNYMLSFCFSNISNVGGILSWAIIFKVISLLSCYNFPN